MLPLIPAAPLPGHYVGAIQSHREKLLAAAKPAEYRKLLAYALDRLAHAREELDLRKDGSFRESFDDGFPPDKSWMRGTWKAVPKGVELSVKRDKPFTLFLKQTRDGKFELSDDRVLPKGVWTTYTRK